MKVTLMQINKQNGYDRGEEGNEGQDLVARPHVLELGLREAQDVELLLGGIERRLGDLELRLGREDVLLGARAAVEAIGTRRIAERIEQGQIVLTVGDIENPGVEVYLDEGDMSMVQVGSSAVIVFDVLPDQLLSGVVTQVDPALVTTWETKTGRVLVKLDDMRVLGSRWLPVGLNATVDIVGDSTENAVLIPAEALQGLPGGEYGVYVVQEDGQTTLKSVTTGLMDATRVEIVSGLEVGETVVLGDPGN